ncbi:rho GTPase-activating protein SYDE2 isoform X2 [Chelonia mydas]|uniref:rho GTPase-activating protein SYDE2 isoform X2 n=1 Tax=Chelonia mydas TaxID=8469 RepID=UPI001CA9F446|nr:rho GTPase-activating protein SYDE2 isoform X2 [Chelonia mydas]
MADPLRRTLSKLRGRRSQRGAAAGAHLRGGTGAPQGKAQQQPQARGAPWAQPSSREVSAPPGAGSQEESGQRQPGWPRRGKAPHGPAALGEGTPGAPATPGCSPGDPAPQPGSAPARRAPDGEEGDYYDNETLPWGCRPAEPREEAQGLPAACARGRGEGRLAGTRESTGRLRSQLQEAYYLLIHAMHDLPPASPACAGGFPQPVASCGAAESSDAWSSSSGEGSPQQQVPATAWPPPPAQGSAGRPGQLAPHRRGGQSLGSLPLLSPGRPAKPPPLQRCLSDSVIRYHPVEPAPGHLLQGEPPGPAWDPARPDGGRGGSDAPAAAERSVSCGESPDRGAGARQAERLLLSAQGSAPPEAAAGGGLPAACPGSRPHAPQSPFRPPAVSVGRLQKWMCKGRLLSLGMKGRVGAGASSADPRAIGTGAALPAQPDLGEEEPATPPAWRGQESRAQAAPPDQRVLLTGSGIVPANKAEAGATEISPPSPNPLKKGGSINWPFPDKIKSPRTVRKLSMKMKKLPELSRKLSIKGTSSSNNSDNPTSLLKGDCQDTSHTISLPSSGNATAAASRNVISRYHLDSSVSSQHGYKKKSTGSSKSSSKGGYLSDGDSPELLAKSGKHSSVSRFGKGKETLPSNNNKTEIDIDAFRHYSFSDQPKCSQYISGLMSIHFYGAEDLKPPRMDSKDVFCAIQVDSVNKARTALLTCRTTFLDMDHTFNIEIENAQHLKLVVFSWEPTPRKNRVCCHGTVVLPTLFRVTKAHQLAVKLEPRGLIYVKLTLIEQWENSLDGLVADREPVIFGVDARKVVEKENVGLMVPLLMQKCIVEIEKRGCQVVGLYRLCGSAAVKKELREAFERDSKAVTVCENQYPDINVITGVLKDYLRELPSPLITKQLYEAVLDAMVKNPLKMTASSCENDPSDSEHTVALLDCLPDVEKATLKMLLDHLKLVASYHEVNKMTCQNLAVCFGPVLLSQRQETSNHNNRVFTDSEELASALDFKKHIEVLHYLLQLWPVQCSTAKESTYSNMFPGNQSSLNYLRPKKQRPQMLNLSSTEMSGVLRPRPARLDSPSSNRYAGDWSSCGENYFLNPKETLNEADYDDVPSEDTESGEDCSKVDGPDRLIEHAKSMSKEHTFQTYLTMQTIDSAVDHRVNLKDLQESIDTLIGNLERELNKNKLNITY